MKLAFYSVFLFLLASCASYKANIMFKPGDNFVPSTLSAEARAAEKNYVIQKNDLLKLDVYSNKGERLIDPNPDMSSNMNTNTQNTQRQQVTYLVDLDGNAKFPMVGTLKLDSLTLRQAEEILQKEYAKYFKEPFVILTYSNKRVIVLGAVGGQVIPLANQNVTLVEIIAQAKGMPNDSRAKNIRLIRGDQVFMIDLSTLEGFKSSSMLVQPGDIIYVEPIRRPFSEAMRDYAGVVSLILSIITIVIVSTK